MPIFYTTPTYVGLSYTDIIKEPISKPQEAEVTFQVGDNQKIEFVPLYAVNENDKRAFGAIIGEVDGNKIVEFPPTTLGQTRFIALQTDIDNIAIYEPSSI